MLKRDLARDAGKFARHVLPAAVKPVHTLWHQILGSIFLFLAADGVWQLLKKSDSLGPVRTSVLLIFTLVTAVYGVLSFLKARRISRS